MFHLNTSYNLQRHHPVVLLQTTYHKTTQTQLQMGLSYLMISDALYTTRTLYTDLATLQPQSSHMTVLTSYSHANPRHLYLSFFHSLTQSFIYLFIYLFTYLLENLQLSATKCWGLFTLG